jgi:hypothetical protein
MHNNGDGVLFLVIYAIIGFGGQLPVGFWLDHKKQLKPFAGASVFLLPFAIAAYFISAEAGIIISGLASAFVHVTGGAVCLLTKSGEQVHENKISTLGLFTAPGVLGLTLGGVLGQYGTWQLAIIGAMVLPAGYLIMKHSLPSYKYSDELSGTQTPPSGVGGLSGAAGLDTHDWLMLGILLIMCFRSFIFDVINHIAHDFEHGVLIIGISAFLGKIIGGFVADTIGWKRFVYITLPLSLLLFQFGKDNIYALAFGIACLQSSVPVTLLLMGRSLPLYPATASALSLGASIALAGLPMFMLGDSNIVHDAFNDAWLSAAICILVFLTWLLADKYLFCRWLNRPV